MAIDVEIDGHIATVAMNRPEALNAFNAEQLDLLIDAFRSLADNTSVRAVVLTGAGDRAFAAGADYKAMATIAPAEGIAFGRKGHAATAAVELLPQPVIAAVNGYAFGGGCRPRDCVRLSPRRGERPFRPAGGFPRHPALAGGAPSGCRASSAPRTQGTDLHRARRPGRRSAPHRPRQRRLPARPTPSRRPPDGGEDRRQQPGRGARGQAADLARGCGDQGPGLAAEVAGFGAAFFTQIGAKACKPCIEKRPASFRVENGADAPTSGSPR